MGAIRVATPLAEARKVGKGGKKRLKRHKVKPCKIYKRKARGIGKIARVLPLLKLKYFNVTGGVPAALYFMRNLCRGKCKI